MHSPLKYFDNTIKMPNSSKPPAKKPSTNQSIDNMVLAPIPETVYSSAEIYTDGACSGNPGPGGWGAIIRYKDGRCEELYGYEKQSTNNRMELSAALFALRHLQMPSIVKLTTDSRYLQDGINVWLQKWKANDWRTSNKKPVKNRDLWEALERANRWHKVVWLWVEGHSGHPDNERADTLARYGVSQVIKANKDKN